MPIRYDPTGKPPFGLEPDLQHDFCQDLVLWLMFTEGRGGRAFDLSGKGNHGTLIGPTWRDNTLDFDGSNDYVDCGSGTSLDNIEPMTISAWIYWHGLGGEYNQEHIVDKTNSDANGGWHFWLNRSAGENNLNFWHKFGSGTRLWYETPANSISKNIWIHVAVVYPSRSLGTVPIMYINGISQNLTNNGNESGSPTSDATYNLTIGSMAGARWFDGLISEVRIYNRAFTQVQVNALFVNSLTGEYKEFPKLDVSRFYIEAGATEYVYEGSLALSVTPDAPTGILDAVYTGAIDTVVTPSYQSILDTIYIGDIDLALVLGSGYNVEYPYTSSLSLAISPSVETTVDAIYSGALDISLAPSYSSLLDAVYSGALDLALSPSYSSILDAVYDGSIDLTLSPGSIRILESVYSGSVSIGLAPSVITVLESLYSGDLSISLTPNSSYSLQQYSEYIGTLGLSLAPSVSTIVDSVYAGTIDLSLVLSSTRTMEIPYLAALDLALSVASSYNLSAEYAYSGDIDLSVLLASQYSPDMIYTGDASILLTLNYSSIVDAIYAGSLDLTLAPEYLSILDRLYSGQLSLSVLPVSLSTLEKQYSGALDLVLIPNSTYSLTEALSFLYSGALDLILSPSAIRLMDIPYTGDLLFSLLLSYYQASAFTDTKFWTGTIEAEKQWTGTIEAEKQWTGNS